MVSATKPCGMGRYVASLLLSWSGLVVMTLAVTGEPAGMSTRAPLPATRATAVKDWGGVGEIDLSSRSEAWIRVRAVMAFLATTTWVPVELEESSGMLAKAAAVPKASTARIAPMTMYSRALRGRPIWPADIDI